MIIKCCLVTQKKTSLWKYRPDFSVSSHKQNIKFDIFAPPHNWIAKRKRIDFLFFVSLRGGGKKRKNCFSSNNVINKIAQKNVEHLLKFERPYNGRIKKARMKQHKKIQINFFNVSWPKQLEHTKRNWPKAKASWYTITMTSNGYTTEIEAICTNDRLTKKK